MDRRVVRCDVIIILVGSTDTFISSFPRGWILSCPRFVSSAKFHSRKYLEILCIFPEIISSNNDKLPGIMLKYLSLACTSHTPRTTCMWRNLARISPRLALFSDVIVVTLAYPFREKNRGDRGFPSPGGLCTI